MRRKGGKGGTRLLLVVVGDVLLVLALLYAVAGLAVGVRFASVVAAGFNVRASVGSFPFRLFLIPGAALLWPLVLKIGADGVAPKPLHGPSLPLDTLAGQPFPHVPATVDDGGRLRGR